MIGNLLCHTKIQSIGKYLYRLNNNKVMCCTITSNYQIKVCEENIAFCGNNKFLFGIFCAENININHCYLL